MAERVRKRLLPNVALAVASMLVLVVLLETVLRVGASAASGGSRYYLLYGFHALPGRVGVNPWSAFTGGHYKLPPNYTLRGAAGQAGETASINSLGFRGPEFTPEKPPGVFRVVCLGESSTFGFHNSDRGTYPYQLQQLLAGQAGGRRVEVINAGFPYYTSGSILSLLEREVLGYGPDVITLYNAYNDAGWPLQLGAVTRGLLWLQEHSITYLLLKEHVITDQRVSAAVRRVQALRPQKLDDARRTEHVARIARRYRRNMKEIVGLARARGIAVILVKQPMTSRREYAGLSYEQEHAAVMEKFRRQGYLSNSEFTLVVHRRLIRELEGIAAEEALPVVDNVAIVDADRRRLTTWVHLTEEANLRLAEALKTVILPLAETRPPRVAGGTR